MSGLLSALRVRWSQGRQYIVDLRAARPAGFMGRPTVAEKACAAGCTQCRDLCPTRAVTLAPVALDLARCVFCGECEAACPEGKIRFGAEVRMAAARVDDLVVREGAGEPAPVAVAEALRARFGRSLKLRSVSSGGCNGCELELNALGNVNFDLGRYGIEFVASPRQADALVVSGPMTAHMRAALQATWEAMPGPKFVIAFGVCAISGGVFAESVALARDFFGEAQPALWVPGCPPHPLTMVHGLMDLLGIA